MTSNMKFSGIPIVCDKTYLLKLELLDGSSQLVQITEEQADNLGIKIVENELVPERATLITNLEANSAQVIVNPTQESRSPRENVVIENEVTSSVMYRVVKPEDLNLKQARSSTAGSVVSSNNSRGRPRKRPNEEVPQETPKILKESRTIIKQVRTRFGRITKPPRHIEKDFKKIDISEDGKYEQEIKTSEFEPLKTNDSPTMEPLVYLEQHSRKRTYPSRYRCPTCDKAYLGRMKMLSHLQKYPSHGPIPDFCKLEHNSTWNFLILTAQKFKEGPKGLKFCQELTVLLQNARLLAKFLFKPVENGENSYFVDDNLAHVFGIVPGDYTLNENELHREAYLYAFLERNCTEENNEDSAKVHETNPASNVGQTDGVMRDNIIGSCKNKNDAILLQNERPQTFDTSEYLINEKEILPPQTIKAKNNYHILDSDSKNEGSKSDGDGANINFIENNKKESDVHFLSTSFSSHDEQVSNLRVAPLHKSNCDRDIVQENNDNNCLTSTQPKRDFLLSNDAMNFENMNNFENVLDTTDRLDNYDSLNVHGKHETVYDNDCIDIRANKNTGSSECEENLDINNQNEISKKLKYDDKRSGYGGGKHMVLNNELLSQVNDLVLQNIDSSNIEKQVCEQSAVSVKDTSDKKESDFGVSKHVTLHSDLLSQVDELILRNVATDTDHKLGSTAAGNEIEIPVKHLRNNKKTSEYVIDKHIGLHNELLSHVDELMLENVDTGQVSNILDTSSNSDDIMNVDQFVNERFKKLTEPDIESQNASLNLELPPLDMFQFHTS